MEASFVSAENRTSKAKTVAIVSLAVVGALAACFLLFNQSASSTLLDDRTAAYDQYGTWKKNNNFTYGGAEDSFRFEVYYANYQKVKAHSQKESTYTLGMTPFAAMTSDEFAATHLGLDISRKNAHQVRVIPLDENVPASVDWRKEGAVTEVKNQGQCGSCWSFSSTGSLEGLHFISKKTLLSFSEQQLVDCSAAEGNQGCNGGLMDDAFAYVTKNGITTEEAYPYTAADGKCDKKVKSYFQIDGHKDVEASNSKQLVAAIAKQPVSVAIEADQDAFQLYTDGVITSDACGTQLDHGVLAVGYDTTGSQPYYIVKNSWGSSWGEKGYVRIAIKDGAGVCGIQLSASYPTLKI